MIEISRQNLLYNLGQFRKRVGQKVKLMVVIKANAYGHGIKEMGRIVNEAKVDWLGVNSLEEGLTLRLEKISLPILVMGYTPLADLKKLIENDLSFVAYSFAVVQKASQEAKKLRKKAKIHLKLETGTNRQGVVIKELPIFLKHCLKNKNIFLEGIYTHYANIEDTLDHHFAVQQLKEFKRALSVIGGQLIKHTACTAATILFKETFFDLVRIGIGLYGLWPSRETKLSAQEKKIQLTLKPVLTWKTLVAQVKEVNKGETVGYGRTFRTNRRSKIVVLPVGYYEGYDRKLSNCGRVLIRGQFAPVIGRICMNMMMADVTDIPSVGIEDEVVLIGRQGKNEITAEEMAQKIGTINYEVISRINPLLPRKVV